jgi:site-specific DNA recombinase
MDTVIYARISSDPTGKAAGVNRQLKECRELAARLGMHIAQELVDNDTSATDGKTRPAFERLLAMRPSAIVVWHQDRLLRLSKDLERVIDIDVPVHSVMAGSLDLATPSGRAVARTLAAWSQFETEHKSERQRAANRDRVSQGMTSTIPRQRPFGFESNGIDHREKEAQAIREAYQAVIGGASIASIARRWNSVGFRTSRDHEWSSGAVSLVLASPRYWGRVTYKRKDVGEAVWKPIVPEDTWKAARALLGVGRSGHHGFGRTLLGQLAYCGVCGNETRVHGGSNNGRRSYRCAGPKQHLSRRADSVENYVESAVKARLAQPDAAALLAPRREDLTPIIAEAHQVRARLDSLATEWADGQLTDSQLRIATDRLRAKLGELESKMVQSSRGFEFAPMLASKTVDDGWASLDVDERRRLVDALMTVVLMPARQGIHTFDPNSVRIKWKTA